MDRQLLILSIENLLVISGWLSCESRFISLVINLIYSRQKSNVILLQMLLFIDMFLQGEIPFFRFCFYLYRSNYSLAREMIL